MSLRDVELQEKTLVRLDRYFSKVSRWPGLKRVLHAPNPWLRDFCRGLATTELLALLLAHHPGLVEGIATAPNANPEFSAWEKASLRLLRKTDDYSESLEWIRRLKNEHHKMLLSS